MYKMNPFIYEKIRKYHWINKYSFLNEALKWKYTVYRFQYEKFDELLYDNIEFKVKDFSHVSGIDKYKGKIIRHGEWDMFKKEYICWRDRFKTDEIRMFLIPIL